jgi:plasmid stability protein
MKESINMTKRIVFEIDEDLHKKLKVFCTNHETSITKEITDFICSLVETDEEMQKEAETEGKKGIPTLKQEKSLDIDAFRKGLGLEPKKEKLYVEDLD